MNLTQQKYDQKRQEDFFLPDFCQIQSVFLVILIGEIFAILCTLITTSSGDSIWNLLGLYSISVQMISLASVMILCVSRNLLARWSDWAAGAISLSVILLMTLIYCLCVIRFYWLSDIDFNQTKQMELITRNLFIAGLIGFVALRYFYLLQQYKQQVSLESSARLQALQARIRPHFLFNSMNVIASLTRIDPKKAETAIEDLSDLFRATLADSSPLISLEEELTNSRRYLGLEKLRLGERLQVDEKLSAESLSILVPPLSIQPLLENAVYHGIQQLPNGGTVTIESIVKNKTLILTVTNPTFDGRKAKGHGIALNNIAERLKVIYAESGKLEKKHENNTYQVKLVIPVADKTKPLKKD